MSETTPSTPAPIEADLRRTAIEVARIGSGRRLVGPWIVVLAIVVPIEVLAVLFGTSAEASAGPPDMSTASGLVPTLLFLGVPFVYLSILSSTMPFAQHFGVTRRYFFGGTTVVVLVETLITASVLALLSGFEQLTGGWWSGTALFSVSYLAWSNPVLQVLVTWLPLFAFAFFALLHGALRHRFGSLGVWALWVMIVTGFAAGFSQGFLVFLWNLPSTEAGGHYARVGFLAVAVVSVVAAFLSVRRAPVP